ncbi:DUF3800 domain-containing protein [Thalassobius sp. S69A]|uniref:DUF3800 domain-containing protein n=1 Tax=unclassified Thalassovita TaxID=2619711 RepID=UPI003C7C8689
MSNIPPQDFAFYADESGISQDRFTVVGGICMRKSTAADVYDSIARYRDEHGMNAELKWSRISNQKIEQYLSLVDLFFALNNTNKVQFHSVIFDSHKANHKRYNNGDPDIGLSKLYYDLILHKFVKRCGHYGSLFVCLDKRNSSTSLHDLLKMLNASAKRDFDMARAPVRQLVARDSKTDCLLQMNDVVLGAVCAIRNGRHLLSHTRSAKREVAEYVLKKSGLESFEADSPKKVNRFTVWNKVPKPR